MPSHILLDLDNTLIHAVTNEEALKPGDYNRVKHLKHVDMDGVYQIWERPNLQEFLSQLFKKYKVSVFTASSKDYMLFIVENFILTPDYPERELDFVFFSYHCGKSSKRYQGNHKRLALLVDDYQLKDIFPQDSTVLIDDLEDWSKDQQDKVIVCKSFNIHDKDSHTDNNLLEILETLETR